MILTACDDSYLAEASSLIKSCARHAPEQQFYLFLVNGNTPSDTVIKRWHPNISIERVRWPVDAQRWRGIMCCARSIPLVSVLERFRQPVLYLDSDALVRRPLTELWDFVESYDLIVRHRPALTHRGPAGSLHASSFNNGVFLIKPSVAGLAFARSYDEKLRRYLETGKPLTIYHADLHLECIVDQEMLYLTYLEHRDTLRFRDLPHKFNDAKFRMDSVIWHGKGTARCHPIYALERARYEYPLLFHPLAPLNDVLLRWRDYKRKRIIQ